jgi:hypothetical protein
VFQSHGHRFLALIVFAVLALFATTLAQAAVYSVTEYPFDYSPSDGGPAVGVQGDYPTGWGSGSFAASGLGVSKYYVPLQQILDYTPTIGELDSISFWTKSSNVLSAGDWFVQMYTVKQTGDPGSWYGYRINAEPYLANNISETSNTWTQWQTGSGSNQLTFAVNGNGAYGDPVLSQLSSGQAGVPANRQIEYFDIATGTPWATGFTGEVDGLSVTFANPNGGSDTVNVNFEPVPEPATLLVWSGLGAMGLALAWRRRRQAA